jgi:hypothetical protein
VETLSEDEVAAWNVQLSTSTTSRQNYVFCQKVYGGNSRPVRLSNQNALFLRRISAGTSFAHL